MADISTHIDGVALSPFLHKRAACHLYLQLSKGNVIFHCENVNCFALFSLSFSAQLEINSPPILFFG